MITSGWEAVMAVPICPGFDGVQVTLDAPVSLQEPAEDEPQGLAYEEITKSPIQQHDISRLHKRWWQTCGGSARELTLRDMNSRRATLRSS